jgi:hypothetical protein
MSTLDLTREHVTVCRARCTRDCQHGQPRDGAMELNRTFSEHPKVHYPSTPGYAADQALRGVSVVCAPCLIAIGVRADGDWVEEKAIASVWRGFIRVRDYVLGSATKTPHLDRSYAHWPCGWHGSANTMRFDKAVGAFVPDPGGDPDEPVPETVHCPRCEQDFPTLVNWGNHVIEPDPRAELQRLLAALEGPA